MNNVTMKVVTSPNTGYTDTLDLVTPSDNSAATEVKRNDSNLEVTF